jgi:hypothetical protein
VNIHALMSELAACVVVQLEIDRRPPVCWAGVAPGATVVADFFPDCFHGDDGPDGMVWTRMITPYPAFAPGIIVTEPAESWVAPLGVDIEVGIMRTIPIPEEGLDSTASSDSAQGQIDDMQAIRKAILCCASFERSDVLLGQYTPVGPLGGVVGGAWTVMVHKLS